LPVVPPPVSNSGVINAYWFSVERLLVLLIHGERPGRSRLIAGAAG
jgi:hypothetical protein